MREASQTSLRPEMASAPANSGNPLSGLYDFVRAHLLIANNIVLASATLVGALDFLTPRLAMAPRIVYSATVALLALMVVAAVAPTFVARVLGSVGFQTTEQSVPLWRRPAWQFGVAILAGVSVLGFASVAKANQGGLIASAFPAAKTIQENLLSMRADVADIKSGVGQANEKLDRLASTVDPSNAADRCADLACAVLNGASPEAVKKLFSKGAQVPGNRVNDGALLLDAALSPGEGRFQVLDLLAQKGIDRDMLLLPVFHDPAKLSKQGTVAAMAVQDTAKLEANPVSAYIRVPSGDKRLDQWNAVVGCFKRASGGMSLLEVAAVLGDADLVAHLRAHGSKLPTRPLACSWRVAGKSGFARVEFDQLTGKYVGVSAQ